MKLRFAPILKLARHCLAAGTSVTSTSTRPLLVPEEFQRELGVLGLSGEEFGPEEYRAALEAHLGLTIVVRVFPDFLYPEYALTLARSGELALVHCRENPPKALVLIPSSLPPLLRVLAIYHELGHLAAGDIGPGRDYPNRRLANEPPMSEERSREDEANLRAYYTLISGSLGSLSPYALTMYDAL